MFLKTKPHDLTKIYKKELTDQFTFELLQGPITEKFVAIPDQVYASTLEKLDKMSGWYYKELDLSKFNGHLIYDCFYAAARKIKYPAFGKLWFRFLELCLENLDKQIINYAKPFQARYLELLHSDLDNALNYKNYLDLVGDSNWANQNPLLGIGSESNWFRWNISGEFKDIPKPIKYLIDLYTHGWTNKRKLKLLLQYGQPINEHLTIKESD